MGDYSLKERAEMITSSLTFGGSMTIDQLSDLDWLKTISRYGIDIYLMKAEGYGWVTSKTKEGNEVYSATAKGRKMAYNRNQ